MASEEPFSITIPPNYVHWQHLHWALLAVKYFSLKDNDEGNILFKKNPKPAWPDKERELSDEIIRRYYPRFNLKDDCRYYNFYSVVPYPKFAEDEFLASETFDPTQNEEIEMTKSTLIKSFNQATSDMDKVSLQQLGRMWEFVSQFKAKMCYVIDGPGQVTHHLLIVNGEESSKDSEAIDASKARLQELYEVMTKSSVEAEAEVEALRVRIEESLNRWQELLNSDISGLHSKLTAALEKYLEIERKTGDELNESRHEWKKASDEGTWWEIYSASGSTAFFLGFPDDVPSCESHFFAFEDSVIQQNVTRCGLSNSSRFPPPPSKELLERLKTRRGAHDEARTKAAAAGKATVRVSRVYGMAQQIVSSLTHLRDLCAKLKEGIHDIGNSVRALDHFIGDLQQSQEDIADIRKRWAALSEIERYFLGQHLTWEDQIAKVGPRRMALITPLSDAHGEYFRHPSFLAASTERDSLDIPWICSSAEDLQRQRDWSQFTQKNREDLEKRLQELKERQRGDIFQLQEKEEQMARDRLAWPEKLLGRKPYVRPPRPTIHCCPY